MADAVAGDDVGVGLAPGAHHYRAFVGPPQNYDLIAAMTFNLLTTAGLRQHHRLVDVGCGSLRAGRLFIPYLNVGNYIGIEPHRWLVEEGIKREVGEDLIRIKAPKFIFKATLEETEHFEADYALAQSIFSHASRKQIARWLQDLFARLTEAGALFATFVSGSEDYQGDEWIYPDWVTYRSETMAEAAHQAGFRFTLLSWRHPRQTWALFSKPAFKVWWSDERPLTWNTRPDAGSQ